MKIVQVGRLIEDKCQDMTIEVLARLINSQNKRITLDIIGDGPYKDSLKKRVEAYGLQRHITFLGLQNRSYIYENMCNYDLFVG